MPNHKKPIQQHIENGTYRPSRHGNKENVPEPETLEAIPKIPSYLGKYGKAEYIRITQDLMKLNMLCNCDLGLLEIACHEFNNYRELVDELKTQNENKHKSALANYVKDKNIQTVIITNEMRKAYKAYCEIVYKFGISPVERSRIQIAKKKDIEGSALDAI